jgi:hypothetical protein
MKTYALRSLTRSEKAAIANAERLAKAQEEIGGTPETISKARVQPDILDVLLDKGVIDGGQLSDALAIRRAWQLITHPAQVKLSSLMRIDRGEQEVTAAAVECMRRYHDWSHEVVHKRKAGYILRCCLWVIIDGSSLEECDRLAHKRKGTSRPWLVDGLKIYHAMKRVDRRGPVS